MLPGLLPPIVIGVITFSVMLVALIFWGLICFMPVALLRVLLPFPAAQRGLGQELEGIGKAWVGTNHRIYGVTHAPRFKLEDQSRLDPSGSYLLICNHQSWADILLLFDLFHGRAPFLRFFLKKELIWVPLVGVICWALDMPFMQRSSRKGANVDPAVRNQDLETTRAFCEKYRGHPITVVNFIEGTRLTEAKRQAQGAPFRHLLKPKSAGTSFTLNAMGDQFAGIVDVTLVYRNTAGNTLWSWLCGEQRDMAIHVRVRDIPPDIVTGNYDSDPAFRARFQDWLRQIWQEKDDRIAATRAAFDRPAAGDITHPA